MSDDYEHEYDRDSIGFIGHTSLPPEMKIDFNRKIYLVEFIFWDDVAQVSVNAENEREAISKAHDIIKNGGGRNPVTVEKIQVTEMMRLDENGS